MRDKARYQYQINGTLAEDLISNVYLTALRIVDRWLHCSSQVQSRLTSVNQIFTTTRNIARSARRNDVCGVKLRPLLRVPITTILIICTWRRGTRVTTQALHCRSKFSGAC